MTADYQKYRWFFTSSDVLVIGGKSAQQNETAVKEAKADETILHTLMPGSPFCVLNSQEKQDLKEAAVFCAAFSRAWRERKKQVEVHVFSKEQIYKEKGMKTGTFGVLGKVKKIKVNLKLWLCIQKGKLRAVPFEKNALAELTPGNMQKEKAAKEVSEKLKISLEEVLSALPSGGINIRWKEL